MPESEACPWCKWPRDNSDAWLKRWKCGTIQYTPRVGETATDHSERCLLIAASARISLLETAIAKIAGEFWQDDRGEWRLYSAPVYVLDRIRIVAMEAKGGA